MKNPAPESIARGFWWLWSAQSISLLGSFAVQFALIWWITATTQSASLLAIAAMVGLLPQVLLGPIVGAMVDRWNRKIIMLGADAAIALASLWLAWMFANNAANITHVMIILGVRSLGGAFHAPAMLASTTLMIPKEHYIRIQGLNQSLQSGAPLIAAPLGALMVSVLSMPAVMLVDVATAVAAIVPLLFIHIPQPAIATDEVAKPALLADIKDGVSYLVTDKSQVYLVSGAVLVNLSIVPGFALLPLFVLQELQAGAYQLSWLEMVFGAGGLTGGIMLAVWGGFANHVTTALVGFAMLGFATMTFGLVPAGNMLAAMAAMLFVGVSAAMINGAITTVMQLKVPANMQGRVFSLMASLAGAMTPVGLLLAAPVAELLGVRFWYLLGGGVCILISGLALAIPDIRRLADVTEQP